MESWDNPGLDGLNLHPTTDTPTPDAREAAGNAVKIKAKVEPGHAYADKPLPPSGYPQVKPIQGDPTPSPLPQGAPEHLDQFTEEAGQTGPQGDFVDQLRGGDGHREGGDLLNQLIVPLSGPRSLTTEEQFPAATVRVEPRIEPKTERYELPPGGYIEIETAEPDQAVRGSPVVPTTTPPGQPGFSQAAAEYALSRYDTAFDQSQSAKAGPLQMQCSTATPERTDLIQAVKDEITRCDVTDGASLVAPTDDNSSSLHPPHDDVENFPQPSSERPGTAPDDITDAARFDDVTESSRCDASTKVKEQKALGAPDQHVGCRKMPIPSPNKSPSTGTADSGPAVDANLLLHMYNTVLEENIERLHPTRDSSSNNNNDSVNNNDPSESAASPGTGPSPPPTITAPPEIPGGAVDVEAGVPFRAEVCKVLETMCRRVFIDAQRYVRITGTLRFCIDDVEVVTMPEVHHLVAVVKGYRAKRGRPRKTLPSILNQQSELVVEKRLLKPDQAESDEQPESEAVTEPDTLSEAAYSTMQDEEIPAVRQIYRCIHCTYSTRHAGFYRKHMRVKHVKSVTIETQKTHSIIIAPKRKRGRPRKVIAVPKEEPEVEEDAMEGTKTGKEECEGEEAVTDSETDNEVADVTFEPGGDLKVEEGDADTGASEKRMTRSSKPCKFKCEKCPYETDHSGHYRDHLNRHMGVKPHQCSICPKSFIRVDDLRKHESIHERTYECKVCGMLCADRTAMKVHAKEVHGEDGRLRLFPCTVCKKSLPTHADRERHVEAKHNHICNVCGENFTRITLLKKHKGDAHPRESLTCTICLKTCASKGAMRKHMHRHRAGSSFPCDICHRSFTAQSTLYHHKRGVHSDLKPYKCIQCEKRFNFHHSLKLHMLQHKGVRPYQCDACDKTYLTSTHLKSHKQAVHSDSKKYKCIICNKRFPYENSLKMHMMLHTGDRPFLCNRCGRGFVNHSALKTHEASHVDSKEWECQICKKMYKTEALLRAHCRRHTQEGSRFMCDVCGHTFMYKSNLEAHYTVHSNERKYNCHECGCTFKTAATLYSHRLVHKTESPFKCSVCNKAFKSKERKLAHEKRHLGDKPFQCEICKRAFPDKGGLSKHAKTVHSKVKRFVCPVCKKTCSRADNLRVHMRIHREPSLLKLDWKALMTNEQDEQDVTGGDDMDLFGPVEQGVRLTDDVRLRAPAPPPASIDNAQVPVSDGHVHLAQQEGILGEMHLANDPVQPCDLRQVISQHQHRHSAAASLHPSSHLPGVHIPHHHTSDTSSSAVTTNPGQHPGVLVVPDPTFQHNLHSLQVRPPGSSTVGLSQQHQLVSVPQLITNAHSLPAPPPAHHQQFEALGPGSEETLRTLQLVNVIPPAAHSGGGGGGADDGSNLATVPHASMRDYAEHAMLFMQYQNLQNSHQQ